MSLYSDNLELNARELAARKERLESFPVKLGAVLTTRCNLRCIMCARHPSDLTLEDGAADKLKALFPYLEDVNWQGGEPFLAPCFKGLLSSAAEHSQLRQHIVTNGTLIDRDWARLIVAARARLIISIDSVVPGTYEKIRRPGKFDNLLKALDALNGADAGAGAHTPKEINVAVMRSNHRELPAFAEFAARHAFDIINFHPVLFEEAPGENIFSAGDAGALADMRAAAAEAASAAGAAGIRLNSTLPALPTQGASAPGQAAPAPALFCAHPWRQFFVDVSRDADVFPECFCQKPFGNLRTQSVAEIWNSPAALEYRARLAAGRAPGYCAPECVKGCFDKSRLE
jgi:MoaA/NifB/PqqE/SkfB family radical SAM enzyme